MKLTLPRLLMMALAAGGVSTGMATGLGNVMYVGDSITHGVGSASYRWQLHKVLVDNGIEYTEQGVSSGNYSGGVQAGARYGYVSFDNVHSSQASARAWEISGRSAGSRFGGSNIMNWLGQSDTQAGGAAYTGSVVSGSDTPDVFVMLIGTNDLLSDSGGVNSAANLSAKTANLLGSDRQSGDMGSIVDAMYAANPAAQVYVSAIPCWTLHSNSNDAAYHSAVQSYNSDLAAWVGNYNRTTGANVVFMDPNRGMVDVASGTPFMGVTGMFNNPGSDGLHPGAQGDLIMAGNYARAMGLAGRTAGQERRAAAGFETVVTVGQVDTAGRSFSWETAPEHGFTLELGGLSIGDGAADDWNTTDLFSVTLGNGSLQGQLDISEAYISWGGSILFSEDMSTLGEDLRVAYVSGNVVEGVDAGFYVWLGDMLIGEGLAAQKTDSALAGVSLAWSGTGAVTLGSVALDGTGAYAPTSSLLAGEGAFLMSVPAPAPAASPQGVVAWPAGFTRTHSVSATANETDAMSGITTAAGDTVGVSVSAGAVQKIYANATTRSGDVWVDINSGSAAHWYAAHSGSNANLTGNVTLRISGVNTGGSTVFGVVNTGVVSGNVTVVLDAADASYASFTNTDSSSVVGAYAGSIGGSFTAVINAGTFTKQVLGGIYQGTGSSIGRTEVYVNGGTLQGDVYAGGRQGSIGSGAGVATQVTITGGSVAGSVYGGGKGDRILGDTLVTLAGGTVLGNIYGGGSGGSISGNSGVTIEGNLPSIGASVISAGGSGGSIDGDSRISIRNAARSNYSASIDKYTGALSGGTNVAGKRELVFEYSDLAGTRFDAATIENFDSVSLVGSHVTLSSLGGAESLTLAGGSSLTVTGSVAGLRLVELEAGCTLTLGSIPEPVGSAPFVIALEGDLSALGERFFTLTESELGHGEVLENVYFRVAENLYEAQVTWLDRQAAQRSVVMGRMMPEPATATLGLLALCGLVARRRRRV